MKKETVVGRKLFFSNQQSAFRSWGLGVGSWGLGVKLFVLALTFTFTFSLFAFPCFSQGVSINTSGAAADNSAMLDISSTGQGLLIPRMTTVNRPANAIESLLIFNTDTRCFEAYNSATMQWMNIHCLVSCQKPDAVLAIAATNNVSTTFDANWTAAPGATTYYLDAATDAGFTSFVSGYNNLNVGNVQTLSISPLICNTTYYYRVRAANACGASANSNTITQTTDACGQQCIYNGLFTFTDSRDSKTYKQVQIGTQCWMAENLNYGTYVTAVSGGQGDIGTQKYCLKLGGGLYGNDPTCLLGGLYEWAEVMNGSLSCNGTSSLQPACTTPVQGICPTGWHVPSHYEWTLLEKNVGGSPGSFPYNTSTFGWLGLDEGCNLKENGTTHWSSQNNCITCNSSGFNALPGGACWKGMFFNNTGDYGYWWTSTEYDTRDAWNRGLGHDDKQSNRTYYFKEEAYSVRCVKN